MIARSVPLDTTQAWWGFICGMASRYGITNRVSTSHTNAYYFAAGREYAATLERLAKQA